VANLQYIAGHSVYQIEDLETLAERLDSIATSLRYIEENYSDENLETLEEQFDSIEALEKRLDSIAANLRYIEKHKVYRKKDLEALEERTSKIADNLKAIEDQQ
jgi:hypothetical protein